MTDGLKELYDPKTDTELHGPSRWPVDSLVASVHRLNFAGREFRRLLTWKHAVGAFLIWVVIVLVVYGFDLAGMVNHSNEQSFISV